MYCGFNKDCGGIIGEIKEDSNQTDWSEVEDSTSAEESVVVYVQSNDEEGDEGEGGEKVVLTSKLNPSNGHLIWQPCEDQNFIMKRTVGMSQMTSMLKDSDRNNVYEKSIELIIKNFISVVGRPPVDIGTGTGLLSLLCIRHGAQYVFGIEMFSEMANIAQEIVFNNNYENSIMIINEKSVNINASDLPMLPDIIISELLDSALLGESVVPSHSDAINRLLNKSINDIIPIQQRIIPNEGFVFATLVECKEISQMRNSPIFENTKVNYNNYRSADEQLCNGGTSLLPCHWEILKRRNNGRELSEPVIILNFDFWKSFDNNNENNNVIKVLEENYEFGEGSYYNDITVLENGIMHGLLLWWTVNLLPESLDHNRSCSYSTNPGEQNWQDHWQQIVFPLSSEINCKKGDVIRINSYHNSIAISLSVSKTMSSCDNNDNDNTVISDNNNNNNKRIKISKYQNDQIKMLDYENRFIPSQCSCGWHLLCDSDRLLMLNDEKRRNVWINAIDIAIQQLQDNKIYSETINNPYNNVEDIQKYKYIMDVSDGSLYSIYMALLLKKNNDSCNSNDENNNIKVVSKELKMFSRLFHGQLAESNLLDDNIMVWNGESMSDISQYFSLDDDEDNEDDDADDDDDFSDTDSSSKNENLDIILLFSECFYYQLRSLPTWEAISFHYQRNALDQYLHSSAIIIPSKAIIMAAAFELTDLYISHGNTESVNGFDHSAFDRSKDDWHVHQFPYKLANYNKKILTNPIQISSLDYYKKLESINSNDVIEHEKIICNGRCDCVVVWVDYQLDNSCNSIIRSWENEDFNSYQKCSVIFFPQSTQVEVDKHSLIYKVDFNFGDSDFKYFFDIVE